MSLYGRGYVRGNNKNIPVVLMFYQVTSSSWDQVHVEILDLPIVLWVVFISCCYLILIYSQSAERNLEINWGLLFTSTADGIPELAPQSSMKIFAVIVAIVLAVAIDSVSLEKRSIITKMYLLKPLILSKGSDVSMATKVGKPDRANSRSFLWIV